MPVLKNPRHERFAFAIFEGLSADTRTGRAQSTAYRQAYPNCAPGHSAEVAASRLLRRVEPIMARVKELQAEANARLKTEIDFSRSRVGRNLDLASNIAQHNRNPAAIVSAELGIAKVFGHITDKAETTIKQGDFSSAKTVEDVAKQLLQQIGYDNPTDTDIALAVDANALLVDTLEAIRDRALTTSQ
jgi:phage terminase small subunit